MQQALGAVVFAGLLALLPQAGLASPRLSGELAFGYDSNTSNAAQGDSAHESENALIGVAADSSWRLSRTTSAMLQAGLQAQRDFQFERLSNFKLSALARGLYRANGEFHTPTLDISGAVAWWDFGSRIRDSAEYKLSAHITEQITTRISARLGVSASWREARGSAFDLNARSALFDLDWILHPRLTAYLGYQYRDGDLVSSGEPEGAAKAIEPDDAFGGAEAGQFASRLGADAQIGTAGFNFSLTPRLALDVQGQFVDAESDGGVHYRRRLALTSLLFRF